MGVATVEGAPGVHCDPRGRRDALRPACDAARMAAATVCALHTTPVKGLRVVARDAVLLTPDGVPGDRRFHLVDERGRMVNGKRLDTLNEIVASYDHDAGELALCFPDGTLVAGRVELGDELVTRIHSRPARSRELRGDFGAALSEHFGRPLRVVTALDRPGVDRGRSGAMSLVSRASLRELAGVAGVEEIDGRRFRMLIEVDGLDEPHAEDAWVGERLRIGAALVRVRGHVGRCRVTQLDPDNGASDLPTLDLLRSYRGELDATEPLPFGVYGEVLEAGRVALGDPVRPADDG